MCVCIITVYKGMIFENGTYQSTHWSFHQLPSTQQLRRDVVTGNKLFNFFSVFCVLSVLVIGGDPYMASYTFLGINYLKGPEMCGGRFRKGLPKLRVRFIELGSISVSMGKHVNCFFFFKGGDMESERGSKELIVRQLYKVRN